ncbi:MAG: aminopeptidase P family protein [Myxococcota bacterium]
MEPSSATQGRRARLLEKLGDRPALVYAGSPVSRNYPAATYPFRASSHFLYLFGLSLEGAVGLFEAGRTTLFLPMVDAEDALWHGPRPSFRALAEATGCAVAPLDQLPDAILAEDCATLPAPDAATRTAQATLLERPIAHGTLNDADLALAEALIELRLYHDEAAEAELRKAAEATVAAHRQGMQASTVGGTEHAVRAAMEGEFLQRGMGPAYGSIVTVHGEVLHNHYHGNSLADGDLLLADVGAETAAGWAADVTRSWPVNGKFSSTQRAIYEVVLSAQEAAIASAVPGARYRDVHLTACRALAAGLVELGIFSGDPEELVADGAHALFFPHGVGHLLGLDVHDMEDLGDLAGYAKGRERSAQFGLAYLRLDRDLEPGMAVTIEPGFYQVPAILHDEDRCRVAGDRLDRTALERFKDVRGIRIEDDVLVSATGPEVLTADAPKTVDAVEAWMAAAAE